MSTTEQRRRAFHLDAGGDYIQSLFDAPRADRACRACVRDEGRGALAFRRLGRAGDGCEQIAVTNAVGVVALRAAAPTVPLVTVICVPAGIEARNHGSSWSAVSPEAARRAS